PGFVPAHHPPFGQAGGALSGCALPRRDSSSPSVARKNVPGVPCARGQVAARRRLLRAALRAVRSWLESRRTWVRRRPPWMLAMRSEEHTSELQSLAYLVCRLLLEKKKKKMQKIRG